jgi:hypothetical protein
VNCVFFGGALATETEIALKDYADFVERSEAVSPDGAAGS